jgi:hypothetical protein
MAAAEARLAQAMAPEPPPPDLRRRVHRAVARAWREEHPGVWARIYDTLRGALRRPSARLAWGAIAVLFLVALLAVWIAPGEGQPLPGTAWVEIKLWVVLAVGLVLGVLAALLYWRSRR